MHSFWSLDPYHSNSRLDMHTDWSDDETLYNNNV